MIIWDTGKKTYQILIINFNGLIDKKIYMINQAENF